MLFSAIFIIWGGKSSNHRKLFPANSCQFKCPVSNLIEHFLNLIISYDQIVANLPWKATEIVKFLKIFKIWVFAKFGKFAVACVPDGITSWKCLFRPNYEIFSAKIQKVSKVGKIRKYEEERVLKKRFHLFKRLVYKNGKTVNMQFVAGRLVICYVGKLFNSVNFFLSSRNITQLAVHSSRRLIFFSGSCQCGDYLFTFFQTLKCSSGLVECSFDNPAKFLFSPNIYRSKSEKNLFLKKIHQIVPPDTSKAVMTILQRNVGIKFEHFLLKPGKSWKFSNFSQKKTPKNFSGRVECSFVKPAKMFWVKVHFFAKFLESLKFYERFRKKCFFAKSFIK